MQSRIELSEQPLVQKLWGEPPYDQIISIFPFSRGHGTQKKNRVGEIPAAWTCLSGQVKSYKYKLHRRLLSDGAFVYLIALPAPPPPPPPPPIPHSLLHQILDGPCNRKSSQMQQHELVALIIKSPINVKMYKCKNGNGTNSHLRSSRMWAQKQNLITKLH